MVSDIPIRGFTGNTPFRATGSDWTEPPHTPVGIETLRSRFINADSAEGMQGFITKYGIDISVYGALAMQAVMVAVLNVKALIDCGGVTLESLEHAAIHLGGEADRQRFLFCLHMSDVVLSRNALKEEMVGLSRVLEAGYDGSMSADDLKAMMDSINSKVQQYGLLEETILPGDWYMKYLEEPPDGDAWGALRHNRPPLGWFSAFDETIYFACGVDEIREFVGKELTIEECAPIAAQAFVDTAISAHLRRAAVISENSHETISCTDFIETIWYSLFDAFRGGRVGRCHVCGKPYISKMERGKPRRYCSDTCSKRAQRSGISKKRTKGI